MRVLFLANYFPKPGNLTMGTWALEQAKGFVREGIDLRVVSFTSWVPRAAARSAGAKAYAECPARYSFDADDGKLVDVRYPRWLYYPMGALMRLQEKRPGIVGSVAWHTAKRELRRQIAEFKPDVIYVHHTLPNGYLAERIKRETGIPYVMTEHTFEAFKDAIGKPAQVKVRGPIVEGASRMISVADQMRRYGEEAFPKARHLTVHNGTHPLPAEVMERPRPADLLGKKVVFSAAMFYERKGIPLLVEAFARVAGKHPEAVLRIAGDGTERPNIERAIAAVRAAAPETADRITLLGKIPHGQTMSEMVWADVFALIGWDEPFATVFIEAMSAGTPVITANDGGINDVVKDGVHGLAIVPRSLEAATAALEHMLSDEADRKRMGENAMAMAREKLTWSANARTMRGIFEAAKAGR